MTQSDSPMMQSDAAGAVRPQLASPAAATASSRKQRLKQWWGRRRGWIGIGSSFLLLCGLTLTLSLTAGAPSQNLLGADNPAPEGGMALAEILRQQGVAVTQANTLDSVLGTQSSKPATLLIFDQRQVLNPAQVGRLRATGMRLVWVTPGPLTLSALSDGAPERGVQSAGLSSGPPGQSRMTLSADCALPEAQTARNISIPASASQLYTAPMTCFRPQEPARGEAGVLGQTADGQLTAIGSPALFSNAELARNGNAALALNLLGKDQKLIWYLPGIDDLPETQRPQGITWFLPAWVTPVSLWLAGVALLAMLWRGRRNGPLVEEPLPVVVKASETALGRARLYQDARAAEMAATNLRSAALQRLSRHLRLGRESGREEVLRAAQAYSTLDEAELRRILLEELPLDRNLASWAERLQQAEDEIINNLHHSSKKPITKETQHKKPRSHDRNPS